VLQITLKLDSQNPQNKEEEGRILQIVDEEGKSQ
jgi:hypothetical protein